MEVGTAPLGREPRCKNVKKSKPNAMSRFTSPERHGFAINKTTWSRSEEKTQTKISRKILCTHLVVAVFPINVSCMIVAKLRLRAPELVAVESVKESGKKAD